MTRQKVPAANRWEPIIGFSRAIKVGNQAEDMIVEIEAEALLEN